MFFNRKSSDSADNRKSPRINFFQSSYYMLQDREKIARECWLFNISRDGLGFETDDMNLKQGDQIQVLIRFGSKIRKEQAQVRFSSRELNKYRCGCAFVAPDSERIFLIDEYISQKQDGGAAG